MLPQPTKWLNELTSTKPSAYNGIVVANDDPLRIGRIRVRVLEYYGSSSEIPDEHLPWINQKPVTFLGGCSSFAVPEIGTSVRVEFPSSNPYFAFYVGGGITTDRGNTFFDEDYPNIYGFSDSSGNAFKVNKRTNTIDIVHVNGSKIKILSNGNIILNGETHINGQLYVNNKPIDGHTHGGVENGGGNTAPL